MSLAFVGSTFSGAISVVPSFFSRRSQAGRIDSQVVFKPVQPQQPRGLFVCSCAGPGCTTPAAPRRLHHTGCTTTAILQIRRQGWAEEGSAKEMDGGGRENDRQRARQAMDMA
jgi:hypothetical protein